jgi:hypothetical protein
MCRRIAFAAAIVLIAGCVGHVALAANGGGRGAPAVGPRGGNAPGFGGPDFQAGAPNKNAPPPSPGANGPNQAGNNTPQNGNGQPADCPPGANGTQSSSAQGNNPSGKSKPVAGTIASMTDTSLTLTLKDGKSATITLAATVKVMSFGKDITMASLAVGDQVSVAKTDASGNATLIVKGRQRKPPPDANGNQTTAAGGATNQGPPPGQNGANQGAGAAQPGVGGASRPASGRGR